MRGCQTGDISWVEQGGVANVFALIEYAGLAIDAAGVLAILIGLAIGLFRFARDMRSGHDAYRRLRQDLDGGS
jgi:hypothetical protein